MKHLSQQMLSMGLRRPHLERYRKSIRDQLSRSGLNPEDRARLRRDLADAGRPKTYGTTEPPPWAIDPGPMPEKPIDLGNATADDLHALSHRRLRLLAEQRGITVSPGDTKAQVVQKILAPKGEPS